MVPLRLDMTAHVRPASLRVEITNDDDETDDRLSFHAYASELLQQKPQRSGAAQASSSLKRRCGLTLSNYLESVLSFQIHLSEPFFISTFDPASLTPPQPKSISNGAPGAKSTTTGKAVSSVGATNGVAPVGHAGAAFRRTPLSASTKKSKSSQVQPPPPPTLPPPSCFTPALTATTHVGGAPSGIVVTAVNDDVEEIQRSHPSVASGATHATAKAGMALGHPHSVVMKNFHSLRPSENVRATIGFQLSEDILDQVQKLRKLQLQQRQQQQQSEQQQQQLEVSNVGISSNVADLVATPTSNPPSPFAAPSLPPPLADVNEDSSSIRRGFQLIAGDSEYEEKLVIDKTLEVLFANGDSQRLPVRSILHLPVLTLGKEEIDFGVSFIGQTCQAEVVLFNKSNCDAEWTVSQVEIDDNDVGDGPDAKRMMTSEGRKERGGGESAEEATLSQAFEISPTSGFLSGFGGGSGDGSGGSRKDSSFETRLRVSFCPSATRDYVASFEIGGKLGEAKRTLRVKGRGSRDEAHVALYR